MGDQLRVDRGATQQHLDDTKANMAAFRGAGDNVDRQQAFLNNAMEGGVGADEQARQRQNSRHHGEAIDSNVGKLANRTAENTDEFIANTRSAANRSLNTTN